MKVQKREKLQSRIIHFLVGSELRNSLKRKTKLENSVSVIINFDFNNKN